MKPCKNYDLCQEWIQTPIECCSCWATDNLCDLCEDLRELTFLEAKMDCVQCGKEKEMFVKFPACTHHFCVDCSRDMLFWDERRHHINPVQYGCESCGCPNPEMGPQCHCKMRFLNIAKWAVNNTDKYQEWKEAEQKELLIGSRWAYGVKKCPLCKAEC